MVMRFEGVLALIYGIITVTNKRYIGKCHVELVGIDTATIRTG